MIMRPLLFWVLLATATASIGADDLTGLWEGRRMAGPEVQGTLIVTQVEQGLQADIAGYRMAVQKNNSSLSFSIPGNRGSFAGKRQGARIVGHWTQPGTINNGMPHASPVVLEAAGPATWRGEVVPMVDEFSIYLPVWQRDDGTLSAFLRNPDRGFGAFYDVRRIERHGDTVQWIGPFFRNKNEQVLAEARYEPDRMSVNIRGNLYDLRRGGDESSFYARGRNPVPYTYHQPVQIDDGWKTGELAAAGFDEKAIGKFIDEIILPAADSIDDPYIHGFLIARSGKLVLEEYFHGFHRDKAHDTRSASKSLASVLAGAVVHAGLGLSADTPVFATVDSRHLPNLSEDPRRARMKLKHLLTMSSGLECDDGNDQSRGNENTMQSQEAESDWYRWTLGLDMVREPGEKAVYCSGGANLIGAVITGATGRGLSDLLYELLAEPLDIDHYYMNIGPDGTPYMGGGIYWKPRDFMKLAQVMLNKGTWNGQRVVSESWAQRSVSTLYEMSGKGYGYTWWTIEYPYRDGKVTAFFAGGNGGQIILGIPELDLVIAFYAGNYSHPTLFRIQQEFVPEFILPAIAAGS